MMHLVGKCAISTWAWVLAIVHSHMSLRVEWVSGVSCLLNIIVGLARLGGSTPPSGPSTLVNDGGSLALRVMLDILPTNATTHVELARD